MKTWQVGPYDEDWAAIIHAETRGKARMRGAMIAFDNYVDMRAVRMPDLDGKLITNDVLVEAGFPDTWEGIAIDYVGYILDCGCNICKTSLSPPETF